MLAQNLQFIKKSFTWKRLFNSIKIYISKFLSNLTKKSIVWGFPPSVMIEPTNICNLKCPLCTTGSGLLTREKGFMEFSTYKNIIDQTHKSSFMNVLWSQGEPFLNKDFLKMVEYSSKRKIFTLVSTNANIMPEPEKIVKSGLDSMIVSIDGASQETYNKYRVNGNLKKVIENTENLIKAKKKLNSKTPLIRWQFLVMKHNEHEIEKIKKISKDIGVDSLEFKTIQIYSKKDIDFLPENPKYRRYDITGKNFQLKFKLKNKCKRMWTIPVINWNGDMSICCFDKNLKFPIGNINQSDFYDLWKSSKFQKVRNLILKNRKSVDICRNCGEGVSLSIN